MGQYLLRKAVYLSTWVEHCVKIQQSSVSYTEMKHTENRLLMLTLPVPPWKQKRKKRKQNKKENKYTFPHVNITTVFKLQVKWNLRDCLSYLSFTTSPPNNIINVGHDNKVLLTGNSVKHIFLVTGGL